MKTLVLRDVVKVVGGGTPRRSDPTFYGGPIPWVTPKDMKQAILTESSVTLTEAGMRESPAKYVPAGSVLVVVRSGVLKHTLPVALAGVPVTLNQDMKALIPNKSLDSGYLARWLKHVQPQVLGWVRATTADNFPIDKLLDEVIALPPIDEQRRIAAILDRADVLRTRCRSIIQRFDELPEIVFVEMFGPPSTWPGRWDMGTIGDMAEDVQYGTSSKAGDSGAWPIIRMGNITDTGRLDLEDLKWLDLEEPEVPKFTVKRGDLLFNRTNSREKVGKTCVVHTDRPMAFAGYLVRVRLKREHQPEYLNTFMNSRFGRALRFGMAKTAVNQANINASEMKSIPVALPPRSLQDKFATAISKLSETRHQHLGVLAELDTLFASLQSRAFCGHL